MKLSKNILLAFSGAIVLIVWGSWQWNSDKVDYNLDVKPILNKHCIGCHGGVKKAGNLSFLFEEDIYQPGKSGKVAVVKGDWKNSEMIRRILSDDPDDRMPKEGPPLSKKEIDILKKWIDQGAEWGVHWAYKRIEEPEVPTVNGWQKWFGGKNSDAEWVRNEIDHFVLKKLRENKLSYNTEADKKTLIRRVSLDLTGLPPSDQNVAAFLADSSENAYEKLVDKLLASPAFGERWAAMWMDLARYADTKGYERDGARVIWKFRDYVISAFNKDKPFDQFTIEQIAGDLLEGPDGFPSDEQLIATAFHRNTMNNDEGGTDNEEFRIAAVIDRVNTTWEVWHGTTFACVQCHSHSYDPIKQDEYYKYFAFFNNSRDEDVPSETPNLRHYSPDDSVMIADLRDWLKERDEKIARQAYQFLKVTEPKINSFRFKLGDRSTYLDSKYLGMMDQGYVWSPTITLQGEDRMLISLGTRTKGAKINFYTDSTRVEKIAEVEVPATGSAWREDLVIVKLPKLEGEYTFFVEALHPKAPDDWIAVTWVSFQHAFPGGKEGEEKEQIYASLLTRKVLLTPIMWEGTGYLARKTHVFERGNWLVKGEEVHPGVPGLFMQLPEGYPPNRLGLAKWMVHRDHPLTSRVIVNRFWEQLFGRGIVETLEDFGSQGAMPTHPELLDWLAVKFMEDFGWSTKKLLKTIVMSATYRQSTVTNPEKNFQDPDNRWLSRGPRVRLGAEQVRDQALAASGLLSQKMWGPSVMPPQPDGIWLSPYNGEKWIESKGEDKYRRAVYTYWKRTAPYPSMVTFDAPSREFCQSRRIRTNTPLQALVTLNDPVYLEAAENLADRMRNSGRTLEEQLAQGYYLLTYKEMSEEKLEVLKKVYLEALAEFKADTSRLSEFLQFSEEKKPEKAALTLAANVLLNLDEVVSKE